jgi:hypothetical protein
VRAECSATLTHGLLLLLLWVCLSALAVGLMLVARAGPRVASSLLLLLTFAQGMASTTCLACARMLPRLSAVTACALWRRSGMLRVLAPLAAAGGLVAS